MYQLSTNLDDIFSLFSAFSSLLAHLLRWRGAKLQQFPQNIESSKLHWNYFNFAGQKEGGMEMEKREWQEKDGDLVLVAVFRQLQRCRLKIHECEKPQQEKSHIEAVERDLNQLTLDQDFWPFKFVKYFNKFIHLLNNFCRLITV